MAEINQVHEIEQPKRGPKLKYHTLEERKEAQMAYRRNYYQKKKEEKGTTEEPKKRGPKSIYHSPEEAHEAHLIQMRNWRESIRF
jgi:hypothetical protein